MKSAHPESPFVAAARGQRPQRRPLWIMRQAGRYLPEYRELRKNYSFLEMCKTPTAAAEVTLQPLRRYDLDAAILFTDLLVPLEPMGIQLDYTPGPVISNTVQNMSDVENLRVLDPKKDQAPMLETVRLVREELPEDKALIGFVGAPWTLACYLVEGRGSKNWDQTRRLMHADPKTFQALMDRLVLCINPLVQALVEAGCDAVQIFDSWASVLSVEDYQQHCAPRSHQLLQTARDAGAIAINYVNGAAQHIQCMAQSPAHVLGFDWRLPMASARKVVGSNYCLQGNMDPTMLYAPEEQLRRKVREVCAAAGEQGHIFNLGHGMLPDMDPEAVAIVVDEVRKST